jgi:hypothetical protein
VARRHAACRDKVRESRKYRLQISLRGYRDTADVTQPFLIPEPEGAKPLMLAPSRGMQTRYTARSAPPLDLDSRKAVSAQERRKH